MKTQLTVKFESMELYFKHRQKIIEEFARIYTPDCIRLSIMNVVMENDINYAPDVCHAKNPYILVKSKNKTKFWMLITIYLMIDQN